jgi:hypothetical protein
MKERQFAVLIAVEAPEDRATLREALSRDPAARYVIIEAESGARAIDLRRDRSPDCLILDHDLSDLSGLEALKKLAAEEEAPACAVVMLVGAGDTQLAVEAMKSGAHDCLEKDRAGGSELLCAVGQAIEKAEQQRRDAARERELIEKNRALEAGFAALWREAAGRKQGEESWQAEAQLRLLQTAIEQSNESVIIMTAQLDPPGPQIIFVSPAFTKLTGYAPEEVVGKTPRILQGPNTDGAALNRLFKDCAAGKVFHGEMVNYHKDRSEFYVEWNAGPVRNERGEVTHFAAAVRDVTGRRRIEEELRRSEEEFRSLFDLSAIGVAQVSPEGRYLRVNRKLCQMLGYSEQEMLNLTLHEVTHPDDRDRSAARLSSSFAGESEEYSIEKRYVRKDGAIIWVLINWTVVRGPAGRPLRTVANVQDITARKQAEDALRANEAQLRAILDNSTAVIFVKDLEGRYLRINRWYEVLHGVTEAEVKGKTDYDIHAREIADAVRANDREVIAANTPLQFEEQVAIADGLRHFISVKFLLYDERGRPYAICGIATDITERNQAEEALRESQALNQAVLGSLEAHIAVLDRDGNIIAVNEAWKRFACENDGPAVADSVGANYLAVCRRSRDRGAGEAPAALDGIQAVLNGAFPNFTLEYPCHSPSENRWFLMSVTPLPGERGGAVVAHTNITARKLAEEALRESEARLRQLADAMPQIVYTCSPDGMVDYGNQRWFEYTGISLEQSMGNRWMEALHPDDRERTRCQLMESSRTGQPFEAEYRLRHKDGQYRWHLSRAMSIRDERGQIVKWIGTSTDIHDRKQAEAEREELLAREQVAREAAEAANRSKDEFLAMVSHELRSPLNAILGYASLLRHGELDAQKTKRAIEVIERSGKLQAQLIDDLLDTARIISGKLRLVVGPVDMVSVIEESVQTIHPAAEAKGISLQVNLPPKIGQITGDPARLQQVVWNLLSNAVKFTPQEGRVEVRLERVDPHICIIVSDTGKGISPDFLPYVFDRFRQFDASSARRYGGLGLGLALVKYLVELHGGTIEAASAGEGQGATFKVVLPVRAVATPLGEARGASVTVKSSWELAGVRALVVDDEDDARELLKSALTQYGADVVVASSAAEAYDLITTAPAEERPDVMVTDLGMPGEDGYSLIRRVREWERVRGAYTPAVALTAHGRAEDRMRALMAGFQMHVAKPAEPAELAVVITSLIRRPNSGDRQGADLTEGAAA